MGQGGAVDNDDRRNVVVARFDATDEPCVEMWAARDQQRVMGVEGDA